LPDSSLLASYAEVLVRIGLNVQKDQPVVIRANTDQAPFVRLLAEKAYDAGASRVSADWRDEGITLIDFQRQSLEMLEHVPQWIVAREQENIDDGAGFISLTGEDPDLLSGVAPERVGARGRALGRAMKHLREYTMNDRRSWLVASAATQPWAEKMFPDLKGEAAIEALWEAIFTTMRLHGPDPVATWKEHVAFLEGRSERLNGFRLAALHFTGPGTDITVGLADGHHWSAAGSVNDFGVPFVANLPTEEVYTAPHRDRIDGYVSATLPLVYGGVTVGGIRLTFEKGRVVKAEARENQKTLEEALAADEGARSLGEIALVPVDSPIAGMNRLFYETLFDENASCHLAVGAAYPTCLEGGRDQTREELARRGANDSITHVDFMVGSAETDIDGIGLDGSLTPIFRGGRWAF